MEINWTVLTYLVVGTFILVGFSSGWWKEALVTFFLGALVFLLQDPDQAEKFIGLINSVLGQLWSLLPDTTTAAIADALGVRATAQGIQANAASPGTWLVILLVGMVVITQLGRLLLPGAYSLSAIGRLLGSGLGGVNGLLVINLVREYLDGRSLPGSLATATSGNGLQIVGGSAYGTAASNLSVQTTNLPNLTILDSFAPWVIVGGGVVLLLAAIFSSVTVQSNEQKMRKISYRRPFGYRE